MVCLSPPLCSTVSALRRKVCQTVSAARLNALSGSRSAVIQTTFCSVTSEDAARLGSYFIWGLISLLTYKFSGKCYLIVLTFIIREYKRTDCNFLGTYRTFPRLNVPVFLTPGLYITCSCVCIAQLYPVYQKVSQTNPHVFFNAG